MRSGLLRPDNEVNPRFPAVVIRKELQSDRVLHQPVGRPLTDEACEKVGGYRI